MAEIDLGALDGAEITLPSSLDLEIVTGASPVADLLAFALEAVVAAPGFKADVWQLAGEAATAKTLAAADRKGTPSPADLENLGEAAFAPGFQIRGKSFGVSVMALNTLPPAEGEDELSHGRTQGWRIFQSRYGWAEDDVSAFADALAAEEAVLTAALAKLPVLRAEIRRDGDRELGPRPPFGRPEVMAAVLDPEEVADAYADPEAFYAAWGQAERREGLVRVARAPAGLHDAPYHIAAFESAVAMARAAKPGRTEYFLPLLSVDEEEALDARQILDQVGYRDDDQSLEFTALPPEGRGLGAADVFQILGFLEDGAGDGSPVERVRVTFADRAAAEPEAGLLHDMGVVVQFFDAGGDVAVLAPEP